ncbi:MAG: sulfotransferase [Desulfohalobiaceae bacterium]|nr:sulfotransferase [Desulfohalobiaceae bacterium]
MLPQVKSPIFIIGSPRSGTNAFYYRFAQHPELASITNITKKFPNSLTMTRIIMCFRSDHIPTEAGKVWDRFVCRDNDLLTREDVTPQARKFLQKVVATNLKIFKKPRFVSKYPRNSVRIDFLNEIFPDAIFIHLIRDGRAVANSILRSRLRHNGDYWGVKPPGWRDLVDKPLFEACALQWKLTVERILHSAEALPASRYLEIRYEKFVESPFEVFELVARHCRLTWDPGYWSDILGDLQNMNYKWQEDFNQNDAQGLHRELGELLTRLGYTPS